MSAEAVLSAIEKLHSTGTSGGPNFTPAARNRGWNAALKAIAVELDAASPEDIDVLFKRLDRENEEQTLAMLDHYNAERRAERGVNSGERMRA